tara:strand:+ start:7193 stop:7861 length:669 start_codon:yes stop_codon:yes gene_type:complete
MKRLLALIVPVLFVFSCELDDSFPQTETITSGIKWTLQIGSSPVEVYSQLQELGIEKNFDDISVAYRQPFSKPEEIQSDLGLYRSITLKKTSGRTERALIQFNQDKVSSIEEGGALLNIISKWPVETPNETSILLDDSIEILHQKLLAIYQIPTYQDYQIVLSNKWLQKSYDPDMNNYIEWAFAFSEDINFSTVGLSSVNLFFKNGKLSKIIHRYNEAEVVY